MSLLEIHQLLLGHSFLIKNGRGKDVSISFIEHVLDFLIGEISISGDFALFDEQLLGLLPVAQLALIVVVPNVEEASGL